MIQRSWRLLAAAALSAFLVLLQPLATGAGQPLPASRAAKSSKSSATNTPAAKPPPQVTSKPLPSGIPGLNDAEARRVRREGRVVRAGNIQAPSFYALEARDSGKIINFLMTSRAEPLNWRQYHGRVVVITGREYLDRRRLWDDVPLLNVESIEAIR